MLNLNGVIYSTLEELETGMTSLNIPEQERQALRNEFSGIINTPIQGQTKVPVTNRQIREALILFSIQNANPAYHPNSISLALASLAEPTKSIAQNYWDYSNEFFRDNPLIAQLSPMLGLSSAQLDQLWDLARSR